MEKVADDILLIALKNAGCIPDYDEDKSLKDYISPEFLVFCVGTVIRLHHITSKQYSQKIKSFSANLTAADGSSAAATSLTDEDEDGGLDNIIPVKLPDNNIAAKQKISNILANKLKDDFSYPNELSYSQILYPSYDDARRILEFLVRIIHESEDNAKQSQMKDVSKENISFEEYDDNDNNDVQPWIRDIKRNMAKSLSLWSNEPWIPHQWKYLSIDEDFNGNVNDMSMNSSNNEPSKQGNQKIYLNLPKEISQISNTQQSFNKALYRAPKISKRNKFDELNQQNKKITSNSETSNSPTDGATAIPSPSSSLIDQENATRVVEDDDIANTSVKSAKIDNSISKPTLKEEIEKLNKNLEEKTLKKVALIEGLGKLNEEITKIKKENQIIEIEYKKKKKEKDLAKKLNEGQLTDVEAKNQLAELVLLQEVKLKEIENEFETHKQPLEIEIENIKSLQQQLLEQKQEKFDRINQLNEEMGSIALKTTEEQEKVRVLQETSMKLSSSSMDRNSYTSRILDITKQVHKQQAEISFIVDDIRKLQRDINSVSDKLKRTETVTDELIFQYTDAKKDQASFNVYREITLLRQNFDDLIEYVKEAGRFEGESREIEARSDQLSSRYDTETNLSQVLQDLQAIREENAQLEKELSLL